MLDLREYQIRPVGVVRSPLRSLDDAPCQSFEGAPEAWLEIDASFAEAIDGIAVDSEIVVLTWLHRADRSVLRVHPRGEVERPLAGAGALVQLRDSKSLRAGMSLQTAGGLVRLIARRAPFPGRPAQ